MTDEPKKRKKPTSNVVRTMAWLDERGVVHQKVERWQPYFKKGGEANVAHAKKKGRAGVRIDLFGGIDIVAIGELAETEIVVAGGQIFDGHQMLRPLKLSRVRGGVTGYQCCSDNGGALAEHRAKLLAEPRLRLWVECGNRLVIHGWGLRALPREPGAKRAGKRRKVWTLREVELTLADFDNAAAAEQPNIESGGTPDSVAAATTALKGAPESG